MPRCALPSSPVTLTNILQAKRFGVINADDSLFIHNMNKGCVMHVTQDVLSVLSDCQFQANQLVLPDQLDRSLYVKTNKVIELAGGSGTERQKPTCSRIMLRNVSSWSSSQRQWISQKTTSIFPYLGESDPPDARQRFPSGW